MKNVEDKLQIPLWKLENDLCSLMLGGKEENDILSMIRPAGKINNPFEAIQIHHRGYLIRMTEALGETYEGVWRILGDQEFFTYCEEYILKNPSHFTNLGDYGESFGDFLDEHKDFKDYPFLSYLARFEWVFKEVFHKKKHVSLDTKEFQLLDSNPHLQFIFGESVTFFHSPYEIVSLWEKRKDKAISNLPEIKKRDEYIVLYKKEEQIFCKKIDLLEFSLLKNLSLGFTLNQIFDVFNVEPQEIEALFRFIAQSGIVESLKC